MDDYVCGVCGDDGDAERGDGARWEGGIGGCQTVDDATEGDGGVVRVLRKREHGEDGGWR